jgi:hypothetical protein
MSKAFRSVREHLMLSMPAILALGLLFVPGLAAGQTNVGQISGRVTDASGGALSSAVVTLTNEQTGLVQTATTEAAGTYVFASVPAGAYKLRVELTGFKPVERLHLELDTASRRLTETVSVAGVTSQVETQSGDVSRVITGDQVNRRCWGTFRTTRKARRTRSGARDSGNTNSTRRTTGA